MKFTLSSLKKYLKTEATIGEITSALNEIGLEVDEIIDKTEQLKSFKVAHIIKTSPHPAADKLQICEVDTAEGTLQIVCAATNARAGIKVVLASIDALIPNGNFKIKESEIRGVKSFGMLCSEDELLLSTSSNGIIELPENAVIGEQFAKYYGLDDPVIRIEVTPNRGDALGIYGIARDLAAKGIGELKNIEMKNFNPNFTSNFTVKIDATDACSLFAAREIRGLKNVESPDWLKKFLKNIDIGSISAIVDVTNYIAIVFGQPLHAYDKSKLAGESLTVKILNDSTSFRALNNKDYNLTSDDLVISDKLEVQCLAGIIGSNNSSCDDTTTNIILEAACFDSVFVTKSGRKYNIITDSRHRFERNVDKSFTEHALNIATDLITSICGGEASQVITQGNSNSSLREIKFPIGFFAKLTGFEIETFKICDILEKLGFKIVNQQDILELTVPSWRSDISIKEDIVEEIMRIYGYDKLSSVPLPINNIEKIVPKEQRRQSDVKRLLANEGFNEVVTWSFMDKRLAQLFCDVKDELTLQNPISAELNYMRPTIIPNLLKAAAKNFSRSVKDLALFEVGPIFTGTNYEDEQIFSCGIRAGSYDTKSPHILSVREIDIFDIKSDLSVILGFLGLDIEKCQISDAGNLAYYHPTRSCVLELGQNIIGNFGQIHPLILREFGIACDIFAFELNLDKIPHSKSKFGYKDQFNVSDFQVNNRDFAFIVDCETRVGEILSFVRNIDKKLIKSVELFDIYVGDKVDTGFKSVAFTVQIQADDKTLVEEDLKSLSQLIISKTEQKFLAKLRM